MSKEELEKAPMIRIGFTGHLLGAWISLIVAFIAGIVYVSSKTDAAQVEKIVDAKVAPFIERMSSIKEGVERIEKKLDAR